MHKDLIMKLLNTAPKEFSSSGITEARKFGFEMNAFAFHAVIDGIYSNKIEAPVRELATNAFDAHRMVGKNDEPFILMAPSTINPYFMVRDFGPGMDHDEVMQRATTLFGSSKRDSNDQVGMLGLGMKSPFAYTRQYTITCFDGEEKREYICYLDQDGSPIVSLAAQEASSEPRGLMIKFPVQQADISRFRVSTEKVMIGFDPMPTILNDQWTPVKPTILMEGDDYRIVQSGHITRPHIRQGCVLYPLNLAELMDVVDYDESQLPIIVDVPIGTASVSTSREQLGYDEPTKANLLATWNRVRAAINKELQEALDNPDNFFDACVVYRELAQRLGKAMIKEPKWRGKFQLRSVFPYNGSTGVTVRVMKLETFQDILWQPPRQPSQRYYYYGRKEAPTLSPEELKPVLVCWEHPDCTFPKDRIRMVRSQNQSAPILWVKAADVQRIQEVYGFESILDLRDFDRLKLVVKRARRERQAVTKQDIRNFDRFRSVYYNSDLEKAVYVLTDAHQYSVLGASMDFEAVERSYVRPLREMGIIDVPVIVLVKSQRNLVKDRPDWIHLDQLLKETIKDADPKSYVKKQDARRFLYSSMVQVLALRKDKLPKMMRKLIGEAQEVEKLSLNEPKLIDLWERVTGKELPEVKNPLQDRFDKIAAKYPLLQMVYRHNDQLDHYLKLIAR